MLQVIYIRPKQPYKLASAVNAAQHAGIAGNHAVKI
jgi:hypothetical protein